MEEKQKIKIEDLKGITKAELTLHELDLKSQNSYDSYYSEKKRKKLSEKPTKPRTQKKSSKKNTLNIKKSNPEEIKAFQVQEKLRYKDPTSPFLYLLKDKITKRVVAPACKKYNESNTKARDHYLLKNDRPAIVTLLSLVRDAACKLPNGFGTRNDICLLLKESQYINIEVKDDKMSAVVSGALDRLHYEKDPCVKFDNEKKLWVYLHKDKHLEDFKGYCSVQGKDRDLKKMKTE